MSSTPHDSLFRAVFSHPARAAGLLRRILPRRMVEQIRWDGLEPAQGLFVDRRLDLYIPDLVFRAPLVGYAEESVYFPMEHQSHVHGFMPLRMNGYQVVLGKQLCDGCDAGELPLVVPVLVSHAPNGWKRPLCCDDMYMCCMHRLGVAQFVPRFTMLHLDLMLASDADLRALGTDPFAVATLWALRESRNGGAIIDQLPSFADVLRAMTTRREHQDDVLAWLRYIQLAATDLSAQGLLTAIRQFTPELEETTMTIAEQMRQEGRQEGRVEALTMQLTQRFGPIPAPLRERLAQQANGELERMLRRVLTAESLDEVFADDPAPIRTGR